MECLIVHSHRYLLTYVFWRNILVGVTTMAMIRNFCASFLLLGGIILVDDTLTPVGFLYQVNKFFTFFLFSMFQVENLVYQRSTTAILV